MLLFTNLHTLPLSDTICTEIKQSRETQNKTLLYNILFAKLCESEFSVLQNFAFLSPANQIKKNMNRATIYRVMDIKCGKYF